MIREPDPARLRDIDLPSTINRVHYLIFAHGENSRSRGLVLSLTPKWRPSWHALTARLPRPRTQIRDFSLFACNAGSANPVLNPHGSVFGSAFDTGAVAGDHGEWLQGMVTGEIRAPFSAKQTYEAYLRRMHKPQRKLVRAAYRFAFLAWPLTPWLDERFDRGRGAPRALSCAKILATSPDGK